ncbi:MAG: hypothetical protein HQK99_06300 [Nitrospirae bacterium]|nr:hypothetical protein [Nitrospirota bacterium]
MNDEVMSESYCEALAYMIITHAQALQDKIKAGAFISLFLQTINKKYGEAALKRVVEEMKKELTPRPKQSSFLKRLRNKLLKRKQRQAKLKK